jgi:hypothetical protein
LSESASSLPLSSGDPRNARSDLLTGSPRSLQRERAHKRWTQDEAAEVYGPHPRHYQKLEEGNINVTIGTLERLSKGFG